MNKGLLTVLVLFTSLASYSGDKLVIDKLLYSTSDLSGSTKSRLDANGKACALLKVSSHDRLVFEGNVVGDVANINGEYWVYLTEGSYLLTIKAEGKDPLQLNFRDYNLKSAVSKGTYLLTFHIREYEIIDDYELISGTPLKRYNPILFQSPFKSDAVRMAKHLREKGDGYEDSIDCTVIGIKEDGEVVRYAVVYEATDNEIDAILTVIGEGGPFDAKIYELKKNQ